jgi:hypothetical protein
LTTTLDTILETTTHHSHWQLFRGYNGYRITVFLPEDWAGAVNTKDASGTIYLESERSAPTMAAELAVIIDRLLDTIADLYGDHQVAA